MSPEVLKIFQDSSWGKKFDYNPWKSDVYSLGICLLDICLLKIGIVEEKSLKLEELENHYGKSLRIFIETIIEEDCNKRMDFIDISNSKVFISLEENKTELPTLGSQFLNFYNDIVNEKDVKDTEIEEFIKKIESLEEFNFKHKNIS